MFSWRAFVCRYPPSASESGSESRRSAVLLILPIGLSFASSILFGFVGGLSAEEAFALKRCEILPLQKEQTAPPRAPQSLLPDTSGQAEPYQVSSFQIHGLLFCQHPPSPGHRGDPSLAAHPVPAHYTRKPATLQTGTAAASRLHNTRFNANLRRIN